LSAAAIRPSSRCPGLITLLFIVALGMQLSAQSLTVRAVGDVVHVLAPRFRFIEGRVLDRLRGGRSVRIDIALTALAAPEGPALAESRQNFNLSYDLWEEQFAVTRIGAPRRSVSHLSARDAEAWCLENVTLPATALRRSGREISFWVRLAYRVQNPDPEPYSNGNGPTFTLERLIDVFSNRTRDDELARSVRAGPFRIPD
jgi:hypothetical protein